MSNFLRHSKYGALIFVLILQLACGHSFIRPPSSDPIHKILPQYANDTIFDSHNQSVLQPMPTLASYDESSEVFSKKAPIQIELINSAIDLGNSLPQSAGLRDSFDDTERSGNPTKIIIVTLVTIAIISGILVGVFFLIADDISIGS